MRLLVRESYCYAGLADRVAPRTVLVQRHTRISGSRGLRVALASCGLPGSIDSTSPHHTVATGWRQPGCTACIDLVG